MKFEHELATGTLRTTTGSPADLLHSPVGGVEIPLLQDLAVGDLGGGGGVGCKCGGAGCGGVGCGGVGCR